jgi:hypothetical protein
MSVFLLVHEVFSQEKALWAVGIWNRRNHSTDVCEVERVQKQKENAEKRNRLQATNSAKSLRTWKKSVLCCKKYF